ncbi:unnamed protein product, partial [marine sediment metagenome]
MEREIVNKKAGGCLKTGSMCGEKKTRIDLCVIGAGRVGTTVSYTLAEKELPNIRLKAISSRSMESLNRAKKILGSKAADVIFT